MSDKSWQQWSCLGAGIIYLLCLLAMLLAKNSLGFFISLAIQLIAVVYIGWVINKYPKGRS